ncbi:sucrose transporter, partial [Aspergillus unguis]
MERPSLEEAEPLVIDEPQAKNASKSKVYLFMLTLSLGGLQVVWSVQHSCMSPYLLSLGMSKALLSIVWIAGPLTGALVQPYIGIRSDNCRTRWGRRKPFMVFGGGLTVFCLLSLAWLREIVGLFAGVFGADNESDGVKVVVILGAMVLVYCQDFAINTVQAGIRAFIVDNAPWHQQKVAAAWASRVTGAGSILGYSLGLMDLPKLLPLFGDTQMKVLCVIASLSLGITLLISCTYIKEEIPQDEPKREERHSLLIQLLSTISSATQLPARTRQVFAIQFASWLGWFSFLFYATTYIGQLYVDPIFDNNRNLTNEEIDEAWDHATRIGTYALFWNAIVSFAANILLPLFVRSEQHPTPSIRTGVNYNSLHNLRHKLLASLSRVISDPGLIQIPGLTLRRLWLASHVLFAICMFSTFVISSTQGASVMTGFIGISWAVTTWVPFAIISTEIAQRDATQPSQEIYSHPSSTEFGDRQSTSSHFHHQSLHTADNDEGDNENESNTYNETPSTSQTSDQTPPQSQAGTILGLHNVFISVPQIVSSLIGGIIFKFLQKPRGEPWDTSVAWVMRFGGVAALGAGYFTFMLGEEG